MAPKRFLKAGSFDIELGVRTLLMGVVNLTPDSFSHDGRLSQSRDPQAHANFARRLVRQGSDLIDIGGESSRPGASPVSAKEEIRRIIPAVRLLCRSCVPISVDTYKPEVALAALDAGASCINNIMGTRPNKVLLNAVRYHGAAIVLMHSRGTALTMSKKNKYKDVVRDVLMELRRACEYCLEIGIKKDRIIIDPGIGFAKNGEQNLILLHHLATFKSLGFPILVGTSRKSFIGHILGTAVDRRVWGTAASVALAIANGADIVRVHDVAIMKQVALMSDAISRGRSK